MLSAALQNPGDSNNALSMLMQQQGGAHGAPRGAAAAAPPAQHAQHARPAYPMVNAAQPLVRPAAGGGVPVSAMVQAPPRMGHAGAAGAPAPLGFAPLGGAPTYVPARALGAMSLPGTAAHPAAMLHMMQQQPGMMQQQPGGPGMPGWQLPSALPGAVPPFGMHGMQAPAPLGQPPSAMLAPQGTFQIPGQGANTSGGQHGGPTQGPPGGS